ncbi:MAG: nucleotidyltransferase domain-containing protein [Clostridia bacterium]|jgi:predicted nucleotidyltransferase|nr:nucleotidyltransferase domain-containing protein [Clostridia bacterium]
MEKLNKEEAIAQIKKLTEPIFRKYGVDKAYIFGSYARGDYNENSDIDIIIVAKNIRSLFVIGIILENLKETLQKDVDLIEEECFENEQMEDFEEEFYENIKKERVMIYGE